MDDVSASVYEIVAKDIFGHRVSVSGTNFDELLDHCKKEAHRIQIERDSAQAGKRVIENGRVHSAEH